MDLLRRDDEHLFHTYKRLPLAVTHGRGMELFTADGRAYLDMFAGVAVNALGYAHPGLLAAVADQAARYIHVSNYFAQEPQVRLAELLTRASGYERVFFANSGTETTEGALKLARRWGTARMKQEVFALSNAFHGRSYGALSLMDRHRDGFGPFLEHCSSLPFNDPAALRRAVGPSTAAVMLEFIQGEGGIRPASPEFVGALAELRDRHGFLIIADEVQSGAGRTGRFCAFEHFGLRPDIVTMAKPIGGGLPLGAILTSKEIAGTLQPGMHGTTFGGNPVACAAGTVVLHEVLDGGLMANAEKMGRLLYEGLTGLQAEFPALVREVRGYGLMLGMDLHQDGGPIVAAMREAGVLINCTDTTVLRFVPPLIVGSDHIATTLNTLRKVLASQ
jgi:predicted acetylornithine/succinylornithine family transaminase